MNFDKKALQLKAEINQVFSIHYNLFKLFIFAA